MSSEAYFSPDDNCPQKVADLFGKARKKIDICVFTITDDRIASAILAAHRRGVVIRVITDNEKAEDLGSDIGRLADAGISVRIDQTEFHMHHKFAIFDDALLMNGSYNWTRGAAENNKENFIVTNDAALIASFKTAFERLWKEFQ